MRKCFPNQLMLPTSVLNVWQVRDIFWRNYTVRISIKGLVIFVSYFDDLKFTKELYDIPGSPVFLSCGTLTKIVPKFLDYSLKPVTQNGFSYIRDSRSFLEQIEGVGKVHENDLLVTAVVVGLYPSITHMAGLSVLKKTPNKGTFQKSQHEIQFRSCPEHPK